MAGTRGSFRNGFSKKENLDLSKIRRAAISNFRVSSNLLEAPFDDEQNDRFYRSVQTVFTVFTIRGTNVVGVLNQQTDPDVKERFKATFDRFGIDYTSKGTDLLPETISISRFILAFSIEYLMYRVSYIKQKIEIDQNVSRFHTRYSQVPANCTGLMMYSGASTFAFLDGDLYRSSLIMMNAMAFQISLALTIGTEIDLPKFYAYIMVGVRSVPFEPTDANLKTSGLLTDDGSLIDLFVLDCYYLLVSPKWKIFCQDFLNLHCGSYFGILKYLSSEFSKIDAGAHHDKIAELENMIEGTAPSNATDLTISLHFDKKTRGIEEILLGEPYV